MLDKVRWGIIGTGSIATKFAEGLRELPDGQLYAVAGRAAATAEVFGRKYDVPRRYAGYDLLAADPAVDIIYIATPHSLHYDPVVMCLEAGKAVLCEKPFSINAAEAAEMIALARKKKLLLMEAMWTRFLPSFVKIGRVLDEGTLGDIRMVMADFGIRRPYQPGSRLYEPTLGGGALLDLGVYGISLASMVLGQPQTIETTGYLGKTGIDEQSAVILGYEKGQLAVITSSFQIESVREAHIVGTKGQLRIHEPWHRATTITIAKEGDDALTLHVPLTGNGFHYEAAEMMRLYRAGATESTVMPLDETQAIMETMDRVRAQWGLRYPMEE